MKIININVAGTDSLENLAMATLVSDLLQKAGVELETQEYHASAISVLDMTAEKCLSILKENTIIVLRMHEGTER